MVIAAINSMKTVQRYVQPLSDLLVHKQLRQRPIYAVIN